MQNHEKANGYWTAEKMRNAIPGEVLAEQALERGVASNASDKARGAPKKIDGVAPDLPNNGKGNGKGGGGSQTIATEEVPVEHIGKVFFTLGGNNYVCSGNSVNSYGYDRLDYMFGPYGGTTIYDTYTTASN